jgi:Protein of unknown function (DUF3485)
MTSIFFLRPVTYWVTIGDQVVTADTTQGKLAQLRFALHGDISDSMLYRVSTIGIDTHDEFAIQTRFVNDLDTELPNNFRALSFGSIRQS